MRQNISACLKLNRPRLAIVYCYIHSGHIYHKSAGASKHFCMSKTQQTTAGHSLLLYSFNAYIAQEWGCLKTFLHVQNSTDHSWLLSIVIFIHCIFSTRMGVSLNISVFLKLNRPQLAIVYCDIHLGHVKQKSGCVSKHFWMSKSQ